MCLAVLKYLFMPVFPLMCCRVHPDRDWQLVGVGHALPREQQTCWSVSARTLKRTERTCDELLPHSFATGPIPTSIGALARLEVVKAQNNQLTGTCVRFYAQCHVGKANATLLVDVCAGCIPSEIGRATWLHHVNLQGNALTGS